MKSTWLIRVERASLLTMGAVLAPGFAAGAAVFLFLATVALTAFGRPFLWERTPLDPAILLFVAAVGLSVAFSAFPATAAGSTVLLALLIYLGYGTVVRIITRDRAFLMRLLEWMAVGTVVAALWGILNYVLHRTAARTIDDYNTLGTTLALGLPLLLGLAVRRRGWSRVLLGGGVAVTAVGLALTFSRGAWLGGLAGLIVLLGTGPRTARPLMLVMILIVLVGGWIGLSGTVAALEERAESILDVTANRDRIAMWKAALQIFRDHPLVGTGLGTFSLVYPRYRLPDDREPVPTRPFAHNLFLNLAAEGGLFGALSFAGLTAVALWWGMRWMRQAPEDERVTAASAVAALVAVLVHEQVDGTVMRFHIGLGMWMLLGLIAVGATRLRRGRREGQVV